MKKRLALLLACGMAMSMVPVQAEEAKDEINLGVLIYKFDDTYISTVRAAIEKYAEEADVTINLDMQDAQGDQAKQNDQMDILVEKDLDAVLINCVDT